MRCDATINNGRCLSHVLISGLGNGHSGMWLSGCVAEVHPNQEYITWRVTGIDTASPSRKFVRCGVLSSEFNTHSRLTV